MEHFCPACGTQRADGASFCARCGHGFEIGISGDAPEPAPAAAAFGHPLSPPPLPQQGQIAALPASGSAPPKHRLTFGEKIIIGLVVIGTLLVGFVITDAKIRARHPQWHQHN